MYLCNLFVSDTFQVFNGHMMLVVPVLGSAGLKDPVSRWGVLLPGTEEALSHFKLLRLRG